MSSCAAALRNRHASNRRACPSTGRWLLPTRTTAASDAKLLDRNGKATSVPLQITDCSSPAGDLLWLVVEAALAPLAPADYAVAVAWR